MTSLWKVGEALATAGTPFPALLSARSLGSGPPQPPPNMESASIIHPWRLRATWETAWETPQNPYMGVSHVQEATYRRPAPILSPISGVILVGTFLRLSPSGAGFFLSVK